MRRFEDIKVIGDGAFGIVTKCRDKETGDIVAIKKMKQRYSTFDECLQLKEIKSLRKIKHENVVKLLQVFRENDHLFLVFEFLPDGCLLKTIQNHNGPFSEPEIRFIIHQLLNGLNFVHRQGFFHRDIKPENLLWNGNTLKIADFGLAREIRSRPPYTEYVSTRWYRAPEIILRHEFYNSPVDIWAVGAIMAELYMMRPLFQGTSETDQLFKIIAVLGTPNNQNWPDVLKLVNKSNIRLPQSAPVSLSSLIPNASAEAISLMSDMLRYDPSKRPSAAQAMQHAFFRGEKCPITLKNQIRNNVNENITTTTTTNMSNMPNTNNMNSSNKMNLSDVNDLDNYLNEALFTLPSNESGAASSVANNGAFATMNNNNNGSSINNGINYNNVINNNNDFGNNYGTSLSGIANNNDYSNSNNNSNNNSVINIGNKTNNYGGGNLNTLNDFGSLNNTIGSNMNFNTKYSISSNTSSTNITNINANNIISNTPSYFTNIDSTTPTTNRQNQIYDKNQQQQQQQQQGLAPQIGQQRAGSYYQGFDPIAFENARGIGIPQQQQQQQQLGIGVGGGGQLKHSPPQTKKKAQTRLGYVPRQFNVGAQIAARQQQTIPDGTKSAKPECSFNEDLNNYADPFYNL